MGEMLVARISIEEILENTPVEKALRAYSVSEEEKKEILEFKYESKDISVGYAKWHKLRECLNKSNEIYEDIGVLVMGIMQDIQLGYAMVENQYSGAELIQGEEVDLEEVEFFTYTMLPVLREGKVVGVDILYNEDVKADVMTKEVEAIERYLGVELNFSKK